MKARKEFKEKLSSSDLPVEWLKFYTLWLIPISLVSSVLTSIYAVIVLYPLYGLNISYFNIVLQVLTIAFICIKYGQLIRLSPLGYKLMMIFLALSPVIHIIKLAVSYSPSYMGILVLDLVYVGANYAYFKKRKHLFGSLSKKDE